MAWEIPSYSSFHDWSTAGCSSSVGADETKTICLDDSDVSVIYDVWLCTNTSMLIWNRSDTTQFLWPYIHNARAAGASTLWIGLTGAFVLVYSLTNHAKTMKCKEKGTHTSPISLYVFILDFHGPMWTGYLVWPKSLQFNIYRQFRGTWFPSTPTTEYMLRVCLCVLINGYYG